MPQRIPLYRIDKAKKGQQGFFPFYVNNTKRVGAGGDGGDGAVGPQVVELPPQDLHCEWGETFLEWEKWEYKLGYDQGSRGSYEVTTYKLDWEKNTRGVVSVTQEWLEAKCKCPVCDDKEQVRTPPSFKRRSRARPRRYSSGLGSPGRPSYSTSPTSCSTWSWTVSRTRRTC